MVFYDSYIEMMQTKDSDVMDWMTKIQASAEGDYLTPTMTRDIMHHIDNAFTYDHNIIVEQFSFYQMLPPKD